MIAIDADGEVKGDRRIRLQCAGDDGHIALQPVVVDFADPCCQDGAPSEDRLGKGDGTFGKAQTYPAGNTYGVAVVDLDGDGKLDVLSGSSEDTKAWFYRGTGDGGLIETQGIEVAPDVPLGLVVVDLNGDGKLDLALAESGPNHSLVSIFLGK